uniref:Uncharacterized protein n=1 Tax=Arundo donax TaxID=35708 RepID=A0A0A9GPC2_ARUDO
MLELVGPLVSLLLLELLLTFTAIHDLADKIIACSFPSGHYQDFWEKS